MFESPAVAAALGEHHDVSLEECGWASTAVDMQEYGFTGLPTSLPAGVNSFELTNAGSEPQVMVLVRKNDNVTETFDELLALPEDETMTR